MWPHFSTASTSSPVSQYTTRSVFTLYVTQSHNLSPNLLPGQSRFAGEQGADRGK